MCARQIVLACLAAVAVARPQEFYTDAELDAIRERDRTAEIVTFENQQTQDGGNVNSFTATNGIERQEEIRLQEVRVINEDGQEEFRLVPFYTGSFKYVRVGAVSTGLRTAWVEGTEGAAVTSVPDSPPPLVAIPPAFEKRNISS